MEKMKTFECLVHKEIPPSIQAKYPKLKPQAKVPHVFSEVAQGWICKLCVEAGLFAKAVADDIAARYPEVKVGSNET